MARTTGFRLLRRPELLQQPEPLVTVHKETVGVLVTAVFSEPQESWKSCGRLPTGRSTSKARHHARSFDEQSIGTGSESARWTRALEQGEVRKSCRIDHRSDLVREE